MLNSTTFEDLIQDEDIIKALKRLNFKVPTEVQAAAIQPMLDGKDIVVQAPTGTGKTAAFALPVLEKIDPNLKAVQALILCPTRELALQTAGVLRELAQFKPKIRITTIYGGEAIQKQFSLLRRKPQIVVATPGRLIDHMNRKTINLADLSVMILDEADRMLDMGFRPDLDKILTEVKKDKQTALFSATISKDIMHIAKKYQHEAVSIKIAQKSLTVDTVKQFYTVVHKNKKLSELTEIFMEYHPVRSIVFVNTIRMSETLTHSLKDAGYRAAYLHGDMRQSARNKIMETFKASKVDVLIATDVAARGLDIDQVDIVINYDLPREQDVYVHRIGRTGRAESRGMAYTIIYPKEQKEMDMLKKMLKADIKKLASLYSGGSPITEKDDFSAEEKQSTPKKSYSGSGRPKKRSYSSSEKPSNYKKRPKSRTSEKQGSSDSQDKPGSFKKNYKDSSKNEKKKSYTAKDKPSGNTEKSGSSSSVKPHKKRDYTKKPKSY